LIEEKQNIFSLDKIQDFVFWISVAGIFLLLFDFGFDQESVIQDILNKFYFVVLASGILITAMRYINRTKDLTLKVLLFDILTNLFIIYVLYSHFSDFDVSRQITLFYSDNWLKVSIIFTFIRELAVRNIDLKRSYLNPAQLFILSFFAIIFIGALLLMLPKATTSGLRFVDALFTSTSAVCVTGLTVVDTSKIYTNFGQTIIMVLIQLGGLGVLTIVSYFGYFFKGKSSYENHLVLQDMTNVDKMSEVFRILKNILLITFIIETLGAILIYFSILNNDMVLYDRIFFAVFHSVSAFCNAGFSTLSNNLYEKGYEYNYFLQLNIITLLVFGGLGFTIVSNTLYYLKMKFKNLIAPITGKAKIYRPRIVSLSTRIILTTTIVLLLVGTIIFYITEYNNTLKPHNQFGKIVGALFASATPRTAGFNTVNMAALSMPTVIFTIVLMWIGASPGSTGGGIKTSTFAIAFLNTISLSRGKSRLELFRRQVPDSTIKRSYAMIFLSLIVIGSGVFTVSLFDADKGLTSIVFETVSAFATVGLSLGITPGLADGSKITLIIIMFIGRVGMLSILIALIKKEKYSNYRYPDEEILIN
jgi:trk system potassium uptake protein